MKSNLSTPIAYAILAAGPMSAMADENDIETITVVGKYLSVNEINAVKTPTPILNVPQSLTLMTADEISRRGINSIGQIIDYTPGVNTSQGEGHRDAVVFRGVRSTADFYQDGNRDDVQYYRSLYNVEKVEILRGPNALLFGRGGTGGILNRVSKKPVADDQFTAFETSANSFGGFSSQIDINLSSSDRSAYRINAMYESLENHRDFYDGDRIGFNPTAEFLLAENTTLNLSYEYVDHERFIDRGIPTGADGRPVQALDDVVFGDPANNYHTLQAHALRATLQHQFGDNLKGNVSAFYGDYDKFYANFYASGYDETNNIVELDGYIDDTARDNLILSANLVGEVQTGSVNHTIMFGAESISTSSDQFRFNPVFSTTLGDRESFVADGPLSFDSLAGVNAAGTAFTAGFTDLNDDTRVELDVYSVYIQDEMQLSENVFGVLGARFDSFDIDVFNADPAVLETRTRKDEEVSPRGGLIYKPKENVSVYYSYSESFLPRSGEQYANINGGNNRLDPDTFENQEVGVKWDFAQGLSLTAAFFENQQRSPQVADNDPATLDVIDAEISGFEFQLIGMLTTDWSINLNYGDLDGQIVDRNGDTGRTPRELPENTASVWTTYQINDLLGVGVGATYQGESFINNGNSAVLPSYTRVDAAAYYDVSESLRIQFHVENLFDKAYYPNAHSTHQATVGAPLNAKLSLVGRF